jgi:hypothetical protein
LMIIARPIAFKDKIAADREHNPIFTQKGGKSYALE